MAVNIVDSLASEFGHIPSKKEILGLVDEQIAKPLKEVFPELRKRGYRGEKYYINTVVRNMFEEIYVDGNFAGKALGESSKLKTILIEDFFQYHVLLQYLAAAYKYSRLIGLT